jgi:hypothetical protein
VPRKRLRPLFQEVIADADLQATVARVAAPADAVDAGQVPATDLPQPGAHPASDPAAVPAGASDASVSRGPEAFPPPPWEVPPVVSAVRPTNGRPPDIANGSSSAPAAMVGVPDVTPAPPDAAHLAPSAQVATSVPWPAVEPADVATELAAPAPRGSGVGPSAPASPPATTGEPAFAPKSDTLGWPATGPQPPASPAAAPPLPDTAGQPVSSRPFGPPGQPPAASPPPAQPSEPTLTSAPQIVPAGAPPLDAAAQVFLGAPDAQIARRRRRSASLLPPLPSPTDIPEDAAGRVVILSVAVPPDSTPVAPLSTGGAVVPGQNAPNIDVGNAAAGAPSDTLSTAITSIAGSTALAGWLPVLALGVVLLVVFVVGVLVTH